MASLDLRNSLVSLLFYRQKQVILEKNNAFLYTLIIQVEMPPVERNTEALRSLPPRTLSETRSHDPAFAID